MVQDLQALLWKWHEQLRAWSLDGTLGRSALHALTLESIPVKLAGLLEAWGQGNFDDLPAIEVLPGAAFAGARGAYGSETGIIYLNGDWLARATNLQVHRVLNEELGHHLDASLNESDSPGDEGELFARLLQGQVIDSASLQEVRTSNDHGTLAADGQVINAEFSSDDQNAPNSSQTFRIEENQLDAQASYEGIQRYSVRLTLSDGTYTTQTGFQQQYSAFDGPTATITLELAADAAPGTVQNFLGYTGSGYYANTIFHRVINGFMIQGGGFDGNTFQQKSTQPAINLESTFTTGLSNLRGTVAMARTNDPNSATSQFFINSVDNLFLNYSSSSNPGYAVFGAVSEGMATVDAISRATQRNSIIATGGVFANLTEPVVTITSATLLEQPTGMSFRVDSPVHYGELDFDPLSGAFRYSPSAERKDDTFTYWVSVPAWAGMPQRDILREVNLIVNEGPGKAAPISSSRPGVFEEGVTLQAGSILSDPDGNGIATGYQWYRNGIAIDGATSRSLKVSVNSIPADQTTDSYSVEISYVDAQGFNEGPIRSEAVTILPMRTLSRERDRITGRSGTDSYVITELSHSRLAQFDTIVNFTSATKIDAPGSANVLLSKSRGTLQVGALDALRSRGHSLSRMLNFRSFKPDQAAAFLVKQGQQTLGTAVVLNNNRSGFDARSDAVIFLENFLISNSNPVQLI